MLADWGGQGKEEGGKRLQREAKSPKDWRGPKTLAQLSYAGDTWAVADQGESPEAVGPLLSLPSNWDLPGVAFHFLLC